MMKNKDFAVFILSHGRPDKVDTFRTLISSGYSGSIYILIDDEDKTADRYRELYGNKVIQFDKKKTSETFDEGDNFEDRRAVIYARNVCFEIANKIGIKYFLELDDDYVNFRYKINSKFVYGDKIIHKNLDDLFDKLLDYFKSIPAKSIAISQGGDFIGGKYNKTMFNSINRLRKCMNTFFCSVDRPFQFVGRINEDVNTYVWYQSLGNLFMTIPFLAIQQPQTQSNSGGMTELYLDSGTYIKSFYTVMYSPSCVKITLMGEKYKRLHHQVRWDNAVPCIIPEVYRRV